MVDARTTIALCHEQVVVCIPSSASPHAPGSTIADVPSNKTGVNRDIFKENKGNILDGQMILEVPVQKHPVSERVLRYAAKEKIKIRDTEGTIYRIKK